MSDDVEIVIDDEPVDKPPSRSVSSDDLAALLTKERTGRTAAETRASTAESRAARLERELEATRTEATSAVEQRYNLELSAAEQAMAAATAEADAFEQQYIRADTDGDSAAKAKAHRGMAAAEAKRLQAEGRASYLKTNKEALVAAAKPTPQPTPGVDLSQYSPAQQRWINEHPDYLRDANYQAAVAQHHYEAVRKGIAVDSPQYFKFIDDSLAAEAPEEVEETDPPEPKPQQRAPAMPVASRAVPGQRAPAGSQVIRLSADEREAADITMPDIPPRDYEENGVLHKGRYRMYYERQQQLKREGRL